MNRTLQLAVFDGSDGKGSAKGELEPPGQLCTPEWGTRVAKEGWGGWFVGALHSHELLSRTASAQISWLQGSILAAKSAQETGYWVILFTWGMLLPPWWSPGPHHLTLAPAGARSHRVLLWQCWSSSAVQAPFSPSAPQPRSALKVPELGMKQDVAPGAQHPKGDSAASARGPGVGGCCPGSEHLVFLGQGLL